MEYQLKQNINLFYDLLKQEKELLKIENYWTTKEWENLHYQLEILSYEIYQMWIEYFNESWKDLKFIVWLCENEKEVRAKFN